MTKPISSKVLKSDLIRDLTRCQVLLERIANWEMPYKDYQYHWGTLGAQEYIVSLAKHGLDPRSPIRYFPKPKEWDPKVFETNKKLHDSMG